MAEYRRSGLSGPKGLILAIIAQAADDLTGDNGRELQITSHLYFRSDLYKEHIERLGLDPSIYQMGLDDPPRSWEVIQTLTRRGKKSHLYSYFMSCNEGKTLIDCLGKKGKRHRQQIGPILADFGVW